MQVWQNEKGDILCVFDLTKVVDSKYYRKRVRYDRYVVSDGLSPDELRMSLSFDRMPGVRYWMRKFGYKLREENKDA